MEGGRLSWNITNSHNGSSVKKNAAEQTCLHPVNFWKELWPGMDLSGQREKHFPSVRT